MPVEETHQIPDVLAVALFSLGMVLYWWNARAEEFVAAHPDARLPDWVLASAHAYKNAKRTPRQTRRAKVVAVIVVVSTAGMLLAGGATVNKALLLAACTIGFWVLGVLWLECVLYGARRSQKDE